MNEQTHTTQETVPNEEAIKEVNQNANAEQTQPETSGTTSGEAQPEQVNFAQMYDMLTERDNTIKQLKTEVAELKKTNTNLLLKVNASSSSDAPLKNPYESFIDSMVTR